MAELIAPSGYTGLAAFHKYWGKKPMECLGFLIEQFTKPGDTIADPFLGSGLIARECAARGRTFIGIDINPVSIELARLFIDLPSLEQYTEAFRGLEAAVRKDIDDSYALADGRIATHLLWDGDQLKELWISGRKRGSRQVFSPEAHDRGQAKKFDSYQSRHIRPLRFYKNARINTHPALDLPALFTGRALRNIDLILSHIPKAPAQVRRALLLTLTAAAGQMSNMVFAISARGKSEGVRASHTEVGSWVVGYWRPPLHFEIHVWNCFQQRARKLIAALSDKNLSKSFAYTDIPSGLSSGACPIALLNDDSLQALKHLPSSSIALVLTDPPHSDRIPYLEMSELWNAILGAESDFDSELVVSNARERQKTKAGYRERMARFFIEFERVLSPDGTLALLFNAKDAASWEGLLGEGSALPLQFKGCFPMSYSAASVVQDNRRGAMKYDYVLIYKKPGASPAPDDKAMAQLRKIPGWSPAFPYSPRPSLSDSLPTASANTSGSGNKLNTKNPSRSISKKNPG